MANSKEDNILNEIKLLYNHHLSKCKWKEIKKNKKKKKKEDFRKYRNYYLDFPFHHELSYSHIPCFPVLRGIIYF